LGAVLVLLALAMWSTQGAAAEQLVVTLVKLTSPTTSGSVVTITIRTDTGAECKGSVRYRQFTQTLASKTTSDDGTVTWSWRLGSDARGNYPIDMQCTQGDKRGFLSSTLVVN
jgi:hypothetical protein